MNLNYMTGSAAYLKSLERLKKDPITKKEPEKKKDAKPLLPYGRLKTKAMLNGFVSKYQNRRSQLLKCVNPRRTPVEISRIHSKKVVYYGSNCFRIGDIVAIKNSKDNQDYFAQISNLVTDQYAQNFAFLVWLVPQENAFDRHIFEPKHFEHGWGDEHPYPIECLKFVSSCPALPNYSKQWTPQELIRERIRTDLSERLETLQNAAYRELESMKNDFNKKNNS